MVRLPVPLTKHSVNLLEPGSSRPNVWRTARRRRSLPPSSEHNILLGVAPQGSTPSFAHATVRQMDAKKLAMCCREYAENKKAEDIVVLDVRKLSSVADYFVICSGTSEPHLRAISDEITNRVREELDLRPRAIDGTLQTAWIVMDYFDVIVHVMKSDVRKNYDLEALWGDAPRVKPRVPRSKKTAGAR